MAIKVQVEPDLSAFVAATESEVCAIIGGHVYGESGPYTDEDDHSSASRAAAELCRRYVLLPRSDTEENS
jgi:hypothetical protein